MARLYKKEDNTTGPCFYGCGKEDSEYWIKGHSAYCCVSVPTACPEQRAKFSKARLEACKDSEKAIVRAVLNSGKGKCYICGEKANFLLGLNKLCCSDRSVKCKDWAVHARAFSLEKYANNPYLPELHRVNALRIHNDPKIIEKKRNSMKKLHATDKNFRYNYIHGKPATSIKAATHGKNGANEIMRSESMRANLRRKALIRFQNPEFRKAYSSSLRPSGPNNLEYELQGLLEFIAPKFFTFNENDKFHVGRKMPDFFSEISNLAININGTYWHKRRMGELGLATTMAYDKRYISDYKDHGWKLLIVWDHELENSDYLIKKIKRFLNRNLLTGVK